MIGSRIKELRINILKLNQKSFANILGISQGSLSDIEKNNRMIPMDAFIKLAEYSFTDTRIDVIWILTGKHKQDITNADLSLLFRIHNSDDYVIRLIDTILTYDENYK